MSFSQPNRPAAVDLAHAIAAREVSCRPAQSPPYHLGPHGPWIGLRFSRLLGCKTCLAGVMRAAAMVPGADASRPIEPRTES